MMIVPLQKRACYFDNYISTGVETVDMVLWEDTRIVPRDNQLWAIQWTWSSNRICYKGREDCLDSR